MGKKKATISKRLRPRIEYAIRNDLIWCRNESSYDSDKDNLPENYYFPKKSKTIVVNFNSDSDWRSVTTFNSESISVLASVFPDGRVTFMFVDPKYHLDRENTLWLNGVLENIITMFKLGGYRSKLSDQPGLPISSHRYLYTYYANQ